jgi:hypothetical protein
MLRKNMSDQFPSDSRITLFEESSASPSGQFVYKLLQSRVRFTNIIITRAVILKLTDLKLKDLKTSDSEVIFEIDVQRDPKAFWHCWFKSADGKEYLITRCPGGPDSKKGALLFNINAERRCELDTGFEWRYACISPNNDKLAVAAARDASQPVFVYDIRNIENPPFPMLRTTTFRHISKSKPYECDIKWKNNSQIEVSMPVHKESEFSFGYNAYIEIFNLEVDPYDMNMAGPRNQYDAMSRDVTREYRRMDESRHRN